MRLSGDRVLLCRLDLMVYFCLLVNPSVGAALADHISSFCHRPTLQDTLLPLHDQCSSHSLRIDGFLAGINSRVWEVNGTKLERALDVIQSRSGAYIAVLFYAKWCPFSESLRPTFDTLSLLFPSIYHFAVEESALRPSALSQYGVHSFPSLFLHNKTLRIRYYGSRTIEGLGRFYKDVTGLQPLDSRNAFEEEVFSIKNLVIDEVPQESKEICPYPWVKSPEKWLHEDMYLTLAILFLMLRFFYYVLPKLASRLKHVWVEERFIWKIYKAVLKRDPLLHVKREHGIGSSGRFDKGKRVKVETSQDNMARGRRGLSVPSWSSSSLAPVSLAEGSSSRAGVPDEGQEFGLINRGGFWS